MELIIVSLVLIVLALILGNLYVKQLKWFDADNEKDVRRKLSKEICKLLEGKGLKINEIRRPLISEKKEAFFDTVTLPLFPSPRRIFFWTIKCENNDSSEIKIYVKAYQFSYLEKVDLKFSSNDFYKKVVVKLNSKSN